MVVPCVAIGGITQANCPPLVDAGADFLAVIGAVWSHPAGPREAVRQFNEIFAKSLKEKLKLNAEDAEKTRVSRRPLRNPQRSPG
jgi:hypothetical protein